MSRRVQVLLTKLSWMLAIAGSVIQSGCLHGVANYRVVAAFSICGCALHCLRRLASGFLGKRLPTQTGIGSDEFVEVIARDF